jgi:hypothetical protein
VDTPATLVWIAPEPPDADQRKALAGWASARHATLVDPVAWRPDALPVDPRAAAEVDDLLDRARDALTADEGAAADRALAKADALLRAHADLPQAAWLMAEVERVRAVRWRRVAPVDVEAATRAWKRADALDGGRQASIGEQGLDGHAAPASIDVAASLAPAEQAWIDGQPVGAHVDAGAGLHAAVVTWAGEPVWAEWREAPAGPSTMTLDPPGPPPCSSADVGRARVEGEGVAGDAVLCASWVAVTPSPGASRAVRVAVCAGSRCAPVVEWRLAEPWVAPLPVAATARERSSGWPAWATWSVVGASAAVAAGTAIALATALRTPAPETRFVTGGIERE